MRLAAIALLSFAWMHSRAVPLPFADEHGAHAEPAAASPTPNKVIVVTIDGTMWQDVLGAGSSLPTLSRWATTDGAFVGAEEQRPMQATGPNFISQPGYTEIFAGRRSLCTTNNCERTIQRTIVDDLPADATFAIVSSWERIALAARATDRSGGFVSCGRYERTPGAPPSVEALAKQLDERKPWPGEGSYRPDDATTALALEVLRTERPTFTFIGLGDTDEFAHHGDRAGYLGALRGADAMLARIETILREDGDDAVTTVFVTADHGRSHDFRNHGGGYPESQRVWLVAHGAGVSARGAVTSPTPRRLADIAPTVRALLHMQPLGGEAPGQSLTELRLSY